MTSTKRPVISLSMGVVPQVSPKGNGHKSGRSSIKVLHIINDLSIGGTEIMLYKLLSRINRSLFELSVISLNGADALSQRLKELDIPVESLGLKVSLASSVSLVRLARATRRISPQLIQGWMYHGNLAAQFAGVFAHRPVKVVWNIRQSLY